MSGRVILITVFILAIISCIVGTNYAQWKFTWDEHRTCKRALADGMWDRIAYDEYLILQYDKDSFAGNEDDKRWLKKYFERGR